MRPRALAGYSIGLVSLKILVTGILFITFPNPAHVSQEIIAAMYNLTNNSRIEHGIKPLAVNSQLVHSAQLKADDMVSKGYFSHYTPEGNPPWYFIDETIYDYDVAGENLAMNFATADTVHQAFLASPSHRRNILDPRFEEVGFAIANGEIDGKHTQVLVEFFGKQTASLPFPIQVANDSPNDKEIKEQPLPQAFAIAVPAEVEGLTTPEDQFIYSEELLIFQNSNYEDSIPLTIYRWSNYLFTFFIVFLAISLFINTIIRLHIQHGHLIVQTLLVILLVTGLLYIRIHFLEGIPLTLNIN